MHALGARKTGRPHLLPPIDARAQQGARADGGDTRLLLSKSSATGGSTPLGTNGGGSILPEINIGGSTSPGTDEHVWSARQEPSTRRKSRPRRRRSSRT